MKANNINKLLAQLNGIYIPGDQAYVLDNQKYLDTVGRIMTYAITLSSSTSGRHFPIVTVSYGYIATMYGV